MYGLVNKAIKALINSSYGEPTWRLICAAAQVSNDEFDVLTPYHDDVTHSLIDAAVKTINISRDELLSRLGSFWITYVAREDVGDIFPVLGANLRACLRNLNTIHSHMGGIMPELRPPRFVVVDGPDESLVVHYYSNRLGFAPMVAGIFRGLATRYHEPIIVTHIQSGQRSDHDEFEIAFQRL